MFSRSGDWEIGCLGDGRLFVCSFRRLGDWLFRGWSFGRLGDGRLVVWEIDCLVVWSFGRLIVWSFGRSGDWSFRRCVCSFGGWSLGCLGGLIVHFLRKWSFWRWFVGGLWISRLGVFNVVFIDDLSEAEVRSEAGGYGGFTADLAIFVE